jgi:hypothetical protein
MAGLAVGAAVCAATGTIEAATNVVTTDTALNDARSSLLTLKPPKWHSCAAGNIPHVKTHGTKAAVDV